MRKHLNKHQGKTKAALQAGMDPKTALKYRKSGLLPSEAAALTSPRAYATRPNPFAEVWDSVTAMLTEIPELQAKLLFEHLQSEHPQRFAAGQLRTLQRHVERWRAQFGPEQEVFFAQQHRPGELAQTDFTWCTELGITIGREPFAHMLCHFVLPYSNWQWATVAHSESLLALRAGIQAALFELGHVPIWHQTDNSTAATHKLAEAGGGKRDFNDDYLAMMRHFGMKPRTTGVGQSEQNGDVESANGALKRRLEQLLKLRRDRDFASVEQYQQWVRAQCAAANGHRAGRVGEEVAAMRPLSASRLAEHIELRVPVGPSSTIRVKENTYSVPSRLIGHEVRVLLSERQLEVWHGDVRQVQTERLAGKGGHRIDYRHLIWSLVVKPHAFARYRYREGLFPSLLFRRAYDALLAEMGDELRADKEYLRVLHLAASTLQADVEAGLELLLEAGKSPRAEAVKALMGKDKPRSAPEMPAFEPRLDEYDALLGRTGTGKGNP